MSNFIDENGNITSMPDNFKEFPVKEKAGVKNGAQIINGTLYIDKTRLSNEYSKKLYLRDNTDAASYTKQGLRGFGNVEKLFPNESTYFKYVFERELQRNLYSMKSLETNKDYLKINSVIKDPAQSYEAYINQRALINAFNRETIMTLDGQSYTDMVLNMVEEFSELKNKYPILTQFTIPKVKTGERVLSLNDVKSLKDSQLAEIYFQNLQDLGNEDIKKVIDPEDNKRISKLFALLPQMMMYQHGIGYSKYGFNKALPYEGFIGVMQTASEIFINKQLNEDTLAVIFDKLVEPGNKVFKNLLVTPKQYLAPEPSVVEEDEFMSVEEAEAMFEKMGIKPIGEEPTELSTSAEEGVQELFDSNPELATIGTPEQYSQYLDTIFPDSKVKDIFYHADERENLNNKELVDDLSMVNIQGVYFTNQYKYSKSMGRKAIYTAKLDIKAPLSLDKDEIELVGRIPSELTDMNENADSAIHISEDERADKYGKVGIEAVVFKPEQIHILGNEQDIEGFKNFVTQSSTSVEPTDFTNYHGGAKKYDTYWEQEGKNSGVTKHIVYTTDSYDKLDQTTKDKLDAKYDAARTWLGRSSLSKDTYAGKLVRRDMMQAAKADGIFAVSEIVAPGTKGRKGYVNKTSHPIIEGGTGYAVASAILLGKPVYVFNQDSNYGYDTGWYKWDSTANNFVKTDTPVLTKNYAGIGSSTNETEIGRQSIRDVYANTFKPTQPSTDNLNAPEGLPGIPRTSTDCQ